MEILTSVRKMYADFQEARSLPRVTINLMLDATRGNDPFFEQVVRSFHADATRRHPKLPLIRNMEYGMAVCVLPENHDAYLKAIDASGRRNIKKAERLGYRFERIKPNDWREDMIEIRRSATVRQGPMPAHLLESDMELNTDPPSLTNIHDYPHFGVLKGDKCAAFASCLVAGELVNIGTIFGHDSLKGDGVVPLLISEIARYIYPAYPSAKYFVYDKYFGAGETLRRFKRKFGFVPHRVSWSL